jgi:hypothetical protein
MDEPKKPMTASEMAQKRWAAVSEEARKAWSRRLNKKRWGKRRGGKK